MQALSDSPLVSNVKADAQPSVEITGPVKDIEWEGIPVNKAPKKGF